MEEIQVKLFASAREMLGHSSVSCFVDSGATLKQVRQALLEAHPGLRSIVSRSAFALNRRYSALDTPVSAGDEIAVIPPMAGG